MAESYSKKEKSRDVWESLEKHYKTDEKMSKILLVEKFFIMQFEDEMVMLPQVKKLLKL